MFQAFLNFANILDTIEIDSIDSFLKQFAGKSFLNGLYRLHDLADAAKWNQIVGRAFPKYAGKIDVFGYDWLGRNFAIDKEKGTLLVFEPGTGEVLKIPDSSVDFHNFHDCMIVEYPEDCLASVFFNEWYNANHKYVLSNKQCAGYKVPLFLNGSDTIDNLEVSDMEVYWEIMSSLISG